MSLVFENPINDLIEFAAFAPVFHKRLKTAEVNVAIVNFPVSFE